MFGHRLLLFLSLDAEDLSAQGYAPNVCVCVLVSVCIEACASFGSDSPHIICLRLEKWPSSFPLREQ